MPQALDKPETTIVTAFYPLAGNKKYSLADYLTWINNFCHCVRAPILAFLPPGDLADTIEKVLTVQGRTFRIIRRPYESLAYGTPDWIEYWNYNHIHDQSGPLVCPEMYRIWANKCIFLEEAMAIRQWDTPAYVWCDMGCWRQPSLATPGWPLRLEQTQLLWIDNLAAFQAETAAAKAPSLEALALAVPTTNRFCIAGAQFGGPVQALLLFTQTMAATFEIYRRRRILAHTDQQVMATAALWLESQGKPILNILSPHERDMPPGANRWFGFQVLWKSTL
jgi:hypothetical protein